MKIAGAAKASADGVTKRISAPLRLKLGLRRIPVALSTSSTRPSMLPLKACGVMPRWLPTRKQFAAGSRIQLMFTPIRCISSRPIIVISAVSMP